ncbi:hypothetical protein [Streptomyces sp. A1499]|uniref:hypothetical protein n=1 Tax=Streptomyces sp. A1499 TaxID=2563104 RepID=UPI00109EE241|nr:hypothetical protein [Streptomyces sp. A1499]THC46989.1 hypothetical protein E7X58_29580 [Streptomyces sp. A1499]
MNLQSVEQKLLLLAPLFVVGGSIIANLFAWDVKWQVPLIHVVHYVLLSMVIEIRDHQARPTHRPPDPHVRLSSPHRATSTRPPTCRRPGTLRRRQGARVRQAAAPGAAPSSPVSGP